MPTGADDQPIRTVSINNTNLALPITADKLPYCSDYRETLEFHPLALAAWVSAKHETPQKRQRWNAKSRNSPAVSDTTDADTEIPDPIWRLNEIEDLIDDVRFNWHRGFAYPYTITFAEHCPPKPDCAEWAKVIYRCKMHLWDRLWREAEHTALLFRRLPVDFPRLTRLALYIPAALYPDHDQTFINHVLPGTGWIVKHYASIGGPTPLVPLNQACLELADDMCGFIRRIFSRPTPTYDASAVIVHDDDWHATKRPLFDLNGEYESMEQLLTEPLRENYTYRVNWHIRYVSYNLIVHLTLVWNRILYAKGSYNNVVLYIPINSVGEFLATK